jgi:hypothetical protein
VLGVCLLVLAGLEIAPETKKLSPLRQAKGKQADNKAQISFMTDAHMMIPAMNIQLEICLAAT